jgi:hypothetical protein
MKARRIAANIAELPGLLRRDTLERVIFTFASNRFALHIRPANSPSVSRHKKHDPIPNFLFLCLLLHGDALV